MPTMAANLAPLMPEPIKGWENFLPLAKRRAHSPETSPLEKFPC
jgi:hypothetical protein